MIEKALEDRLKLKGTLEIDVRKVGEEKWRTIRKVPNLLVNDGLNQGLRLIAGESSACLTHYATGHGTTDPVITDETLEFEDFRKEIDSTLLDTAAKKMRFMCIMLSTESNTPGTISEFGMFNASSGGIMWNRATFPGFTKDNTIEVRFRYYLEAR